MIEVTQDFGIYIMQISKKVSNFLAQPDLESPCLVIDLEVVTTTHNSLKKAMPYARCCYAVKANPAPEILTALHKNGSHFEAASIHEIEQCLEIGVKPEHILFGNPIKKLKDIKKAFALGIRHFVFDSHMELDKLANVAPGSTVLCRINSGGTGAVWPLSRKFGCQEFQAISLLLEAKSKGLTPKGLSFHVGSQQSRVEAWDESIIEVARIFHEVKKHGIELDIIDLGGGFPVKYRNENPPTIEECGEEILRILNKHFPDSMPNIIIEPGRFMVAEAGTVQSEVILISYNHEENKRRWVYLDVGKYNGLIETEETQYQVITDKDNDPLTPVTIAGPTCDSLDILYEKADYSLPVSLDIGDKIRFLNTGAYTHSYASICFNGFPPLKTYFIS